MDTMQHQEMYAQIAQPFAQHAIASNALLASQLAISSKEVAMRPVLSMLQLLISTFAGTVKDNHVFYVIVIINAFSVLVAI